MASKKFAFDPEAPAADAPSAAVRGANPASYVELLGLRTTDPVKLHRRSAMGLSYNSFLRLRLKIGLPNAQFAEAIRIPSRTLQRRKKAGKLEPDESDRLVRMARIFAMVIELFEGNMPAAQAWMTTPLLALAGNSPLEFASTEVGAHEVESLIGRLEHGIPV